MALKYSATFSTLTQYQISIKLNAKKEQMRGVFFCCKIQLLEVIPPPPLPPPPL